MTEAIQKQIEEMEAAEDAETQVQDVKSEDEPEAAPEENTEEPGDTVEQEETQEESSEEGEEEGSGEEESAEDKAARQKEKQEAYYKERQRKKEEAEAKATKAQHQPQDNSTPSENKDDVDQLRKDLEPLFKVAQKQQFDTQVKQAQKELEVLEQPFREAFDDYDSYVSEAIELSKFRLMEKGYSEADALNYLETEKVLLADRAASQGLDPVEAVYNEAKEIVGVFDKYAEMKGYVKKGRPKTNLEAAREIAKPNALNSGAGRDAKAVKTDFDDLDDSDLEEIQSATLGDLGL